MKITFIFSPQYEAVISAKAVPFSIGSKASSAISAAWKKERRTIEKALFRATGLHFQKKDLICYINSRASLSNPLSLKISSITEVMCDNLIHELVHVLLTQNLNIIGKDIEKFHDSFKEYNFTTRIHILVHAIHFEVTRSIYPQRVRSVLSYARSKDYRTSWKIVKEVGAQKIITMVLKNNPKLATKNQ